MSFNTSGPAPNIPGAPDVPPGSGASSRLTDTDRDIIAEARRIGPLLRASDGDDNRLAGWLLAELADLAERLDAPR